VSADFFTLFWEINEYSIPLVHLLMEYRALKSELHFEYGRVDQLCDRVPCIKRGNCGMAIL